MRLIGVGEVIRRVIACVTRVTKRDIIDASDTDTDAVLLIDATNAFNSLNRASALHNVSILCPIVATYATNT